MKESADAPENESEAFVGASLKRKRCRICRKDKILIYEFHLCSSEKIIDGKMYPAKYRSECKECRRKGGKACASASSKLMKKYKMKRPPIGIPCQNCGKKNEKLVFDHCHKTGAFRGWLCYQCNSAIGNLGDDLRGLQRAAKYLRRHQKRRKKRDSTLYIYEYFKKESVE
tara:strand:- start:356 stop:865 length:510 start_codon:yes stop_codon:yes gene_type:complete